MIVRCIIGILFSFLSLSVYAKDIHPVAILAFAEKGSAVQGQGEVVGNLLFASLVTKPELLLVERDEIDKILAEATLNLTGLVSEEKAIQIGQLTGAKILLTGSVFKVAKKTYVVAKVIGVETGKVLGCSADGEDSIDKLVDRLAKDVAKLIMEKSGELVASTSEEAVLAKLKKLLEGKTLPPVTISIAEMHVNRAAMDPAAQTEFMKLYRELGGTVLDKDKGNMDAAQYHINGEGMSEFSGRIKDLTSVKARVEINVTNTKGEVHVADRQTAVKVDLNELLAGKAALQSAASGLALRVIPKLAISLDKSPSMDSPKKQK